VDAQPPHDFLMGFVFITRTPWVKAQNGAGLLQRQWEIRRSVRSAFPASRFRRRTAAGHALASLQGFQPHANNVVTAGIMHKKIRIEASGFYGPSPMKIAGSIWIPMNSWATRLSYFATELDDASFGGKAGAAGASGGGRCGAVHRVNSLHAADAGIELVDEFDLGAPITKR